MNSSEVMFMVWIMISGLWYCGIRMDRIEVREKCRNTHVYEKCNRINIWFDKKEWVSRMNRYAEMGHQKKKGGEFSVKSYLSRRGKYHVDFIVKKQIKWLLNTQERCI